MNQAVRLIPLSLLDDPEWEARSYMTRENLDDLVMSIRVLGILQPLLIKERGERFQIIAGSRRREAARLAGLDEVPCRILDPEETDPDIVLIHENWMREAINPIDAARAIRRLVQDKGMTFSSAAGVFNRSSTWISRTAALLSMPENIQAAVEAGHLDTNKAHLLMKIPDEEARGYWLHMAVESGASFNTLQSWVQQVLAQANPPPRGEGEPPDRTVKRDPFRPELMCVGCREIFNPMETVQVTFCIGCYNVLKEVPCEDREQPKPEESRQSIEQGLS